LLETILALGLTAILMGLIGSGLRLYTQVVSNKRADVSNAQIARAVLRVMADDIRATFTEEADDGNASLSAEGTEFADDISAGTGEGTANTNTTATDGETGVSDASADLTNAAVASVPGVYGNESELRLDVRGAFAHPVRYDAIIEAGGDPFVNNLVSVDRVVTYYLRTSDPSELAGTPLESPAASTTDQSTILVRRIQKRAEAELDSAMSGGADAQSGEQLLSDYVVGLSFQYHDGLDWTDSWDSELDGLPIAIQVTVTVADPTDDQSTINEDNIFRMTVALPTAAPSEDATTTTGI